MRDVEEEKERAEQDHQVRLEAVRAQAAALEHQVRVVEEERERADEQVDVFEGELEEAMRERDEVCGPTPHLFLGSCSPYAALITLASHALQAEARAAALAAELASTRTEVRAYFGSIIFSRF